MCICDMCICDMCTIMDFSTIIMIYYDGQFTDPAVPGFFTLAFHTQVYSDELAAFLERLLAHLWETNGACRSD